MWKRMGVSIWSMVFGISMFGVVPLSAQWVAYPHIAGCWTQQVGPYCLTRAAPGVNCRPEQICPCHEALVENLFVTVQAIIISGEQPRGAYECPSQEFAPSSTPYGPYCEINAPRPGQSYGTQSYCGAMLSKVIHGTEAPLGVCVADARASNFPVIASCWHQP